MSDILIKGLEMPEDDYLELHIYPNGRVFKAFDGFEYEQERAVKLSSHGRMIDADFAITQEKNYCKDCDNWNGIRCKSCEHDWVMMILDDAPTIIEASTEERE